MELSKNFEPATTDEKWYSHWMEKGYFFSVPDEREPYTIVMPPPNVTGILHMGHALNNTIQDILIRKARMCGKNACWVPGTDHASIATEAKVVGMLRERGISKNSLSRNEFLGYAWEWKEKYGGIILQQLKNLGCSLDWKRTAFTMDEAYYSAVIKVFNDLYKRGFIYRGKRMINWDVKAKTALSDEEVIRKETKQKLYYLKYEIHNELNAPDHAHPVTRNYIVIATVRPETIMGDTAVAVNPDDERYIHLVGKYATVPLIGRRVPIIADEYVTMDFGTGALKVTPAHDINDNMLGQKHGLEVIDVFNDDGTMSEAAQIYIGLDRFEVRKKIALELIEKGFVEKTEEYISEVGYSERTDAVVEPRLSLQWWVGMKEMSKVALDDVMNDEIVFHPGKFKNVYRHWMENIKDWCISRKLWWGHRIPAWYDEKGNVYVGESLEALYISHPETKELKLTQDEDCLDTWFSSWIWPFEVFKGYSNPGNDEVKYYYPTNTLVTAPEIIFFWVARMIMAGETYMDQKPFRDVYFTGIVRDKLGRKMSKSLGNSPDLLELIEKYGADAVRFGIMIASPAGNDLLFEENSLEQGQHFNNKLWNALKLVKMWEKRQSAKNNILGENSSKAALPFPILWFRSRLNMVRSAVDELMNQFKLSEALKMIYSLVWDDFCNWYLEWVKPGFEQNIDAEVYEQTILFFTELMQLLHPFMPFISEEIYHLMASREDDLCVKLFEEVMPADELIIEKGLLLRDVISGLRDTRNKQRLKPKEPVDLYVMTADSSNYIGIQDILCRQVNAKSFSFTDAPVAGTISCVVGKDQFYIRAEQAVNLVQQKEELANELKHLQGFLVNVERKLGNEKFVQNAKPDVLAMEQKKKRDAEEKIRVIAESLAIL